MRRKIVILGVTGSIAAHRAVDLASLLVKDGCVVHVVMTADAQKFVTPLPFKTLSRNPVVTDLYDVEEGWKPAHIELADRADLLLIAPATANVLAKLSHGLADDPLSCIALALNDKAGVLIAPAMNGKMWLHPATQANAALLTKRGAEFIGPEKGLLSCGYEGIGRLWPVEKIAQSAAALAPVNYETKTDAAAGPIQKLTRLLAAPIIEPSQRAARIQAVERDIVLPLRFLIVAILGYYFFFSGWFDTPGANKATDWTLHHAKMLKVSFLTYAFLNVLVAWAFIRSKRLSLGENTVDCLCDGSFRRRDDGDPDLPDRRIQQRSLSGFSWRWFCTTPWPYLWPFRNCW